MIDSELDLLAVALQDPRIIGSTRLDAADFADPRHEAIWRAIETIHNDGQKPDPVLIVNRASSNGVRIDHGHITNLLDRFHAIPVNADAYAAHIREAAMLRRVDAALVKARQQVEAGLPAEQIIRDIAATASGAAADEQLLSSVMSLDDFCDQVLPPEQWIIPGLLSRGDRLILTSFEGGGKTMAMRQIGICAAAGMAPFSGDRIPPRRVLFVDAENPLPTMVRKMRAIRNATKAETEDRMWVKRYPQGLDLGAQPDRLALRELCRAFRPDLLLIGPAYKLYIGGKIDREEDLARTVTATLDGLREEYGFAVILEHHSPHQQQGSQRRNVRPIGSSLWMRWPEFGLGLAPADDTTEDRRAVDVIPWRGAREERDWPRRLVQGHILPWVDDSERARR